MRDRDGGAAWCAKGPILSLVCWSIFKWWLRHWDASSNLRLHPTFILFTSKNHNIAQKAWKHVSILENKQTTMNTVVFKHWMCAAMMPDLFEIILPLEALWTAGSFDHMINLDLRAGFTVINLDLNHHILSRYIIKTDFHGPQDTYKVADDKNIRANGNTHFHSSFKHHWTGTIFHLTYSIARWWKPSDADWRQSAWDSLHQHDTTRRWAD